MLLRNMMERTVDTALHDGKISFYRVGMDVAANVFADAVIDGAMKSEFTADFLCRAAFVRHNIGRAVDLSIDDRPQIAGVDGRHMVRAHFATTLYKREHGFFANATGAFMVALATMFVFLQPADEALVNLDHLAVAAKHIRIGFATRFTNAMAKEPRGFFASYAHPTNLKGTHALLRSHHKMRRGKPLMQWNFATLVERANSDR